MPNTIQIGKITNYNPHLFVQMSSLDKANPVYQIATCAPDSRWETVNQFCALLTTAWLNDLSSPASFGLNDLPDPVKVNMAVQLIGLTGLDKQVSDAAASIANSKSYATPKQFIAAIPGFPVGTKIWAGTNSHVVGFLITSVATTGKGAQPGTFSFYDSTVGTVQTLQSTADLAGRVQQRAYTAFVVGTPAS